MKVAIALTIIASLLVLSNASYFPYGGGSGMYMGHGYGYGNVDHLASWTPEAVQYVASLLPHDANEEQEELAKQFSLMLEGCLRHLTAHHVGTYKHCLYFWKNKAAAAFVRMNPLAGVVGGVTPLGAYPFP